MQEIINKLLNRNFILYFIIGISGVILDLSIFSFCYKVILLNEIYSNIISSFVGFNNNFFLNAFFNFKAKDKLWIRYLSYFTICLFGIGISSTLIYIAVHFLGINAILAKTGSIGVVFILQYGLNKKITFRELS